MCTGENSALNKSYDADKDVNLSFYLAKYYFHVFILL